MTKSFNDGDIVYFNPITESKCTNYTTSQSNTGVKSGCMKWYVFNSSSDSNKVNLLLDHNTTENVAWNSDYYSSSMGEIQTDLNNLVSNSNWKVTPRLITISELRTIAGVASSTTGDFELGTNEWAYGRFDNGTSGYWTGSSVDYYTSQAWYVFNTGEVSRDSIESNQFGVRPVIEVLKSKL